MDLFKTCWDSLKWSAVSCSKNVGRWIGMSLLMCIPVAHFIPAGAFLKIFSGEEPSFAEAGRSFFKGFLLFVINVVYMFIPFILLAAGENLLQNKNSLGLGVILCILSVILFIVLGLFQVPAVVNFARSGRITRAFAFREIIALIGKTGPGQYVLSWFVLIIMNIALSLVLMLLVGLCGTFSVLISVIPVFGLLLLIVFCTVTGIVYLLLAPLIAMWYNKYWNAVFE
ncbi:MAG TPA: DUF4013 domain-containing protein [Methanocorpusculum sp.]|nr:DUF4013 domain-containing protein [Methanocorpusculum sp.]